MSFEPVLARDGGTPTASRSTAGCCPICRRRRTARDRVLEAAPANARALERLVREVLPHAGVETIRDYADLDRFVVAVVPPEG